MNPHADQPISFSAFINSFRQNRQLIMQMTRREVIGRYKGSAFGVAWSFLNPLLMLAVYTFVFSVVLKTRWAGDATESKTQFALILFVGMIVHGLFAEAINRAPSLIVGNANYVKKVVFPLDSLPITSSFAALFHACASLCVFIVAFVAVNGYLHWTACFIPLIWLPLVVLAIGLSWLLSSLAVFVRDVNQITGILTTALLFLSPVFYPMSALPKQFSALIIANPLTFIIEQSRDVLVWGRMPDWNGLSIYMVVATTIAWLSFIWFQKTRKGFADVL